MKYHVARKIELARFIWANIPEVRGLGIKSNSTGPSNTNFIVLPVCLLYENGPNNKTSLSDLSTWIINPLGFH